MRMSSFLPRYVATFSVPFLLLSLGGASRARAAGFELTPPGARANGRAGAAVAGADDALGVFYNPATILATRTRVSAAVALHLHLSETCLRRTEVVEDSDGTRSAGPVLPEVCDDGPLTFIPELASTVRLGERWALSIAAYAPTGATAHSKYGNPRTGTVDGKTGEDAPERRTPSRYLLLEQKSLQVFPTLGVAYQPIPALRLGASFGWGITQVDFANASFSRTLVLGSVNATSDISNHLKGLDAFVPRVQVGAWTQPWERLALEFGASFVWTDDVKISNATLKLRGLNTDIYPPDYAAISEKPLVRGQFKHVDVTVPQTSQLALGTRYAKKLDMPADKIGDRLSSELFDIELDVVVALTKRMDAVRVTPPHGAELPVDSPPPGVIPPFEVVLPEHIVLEHHWQNQVGLRLGGDYNPIPGVLGLRAGVSYESTGVEQGYENLDFTPFQNVGLHLGATLRIVHKIDLSSSFAQHIFATVKTSIKRAGVRRVTSGDLVEGDDTIVNAGSYTRRSSVLALQVSAHF